MKTSLREHLYIVPNGALKWIIRDIRFFASNHNEWLDLEDGFITDKVGVSVFFDIHPLQRNYFFTEKLPELISIVKKHGGVAEWAHEEN